MAPNFYALLDKQQKVGATLHEVTEGFDTGPIIAQTAVPVTPDDSVYILNQKTADRGGQMLSDLLRTADLNHVTPATQPEGAWPDYSYPSPARVAEFRKRGLRF